MKKTSLKDIAARAKVSTTTVSFVLNGKARDKRISKMVIKRVEAIVKKMDYKPNQMARGLRTGKTKTFGLMVEDISNPFFAKLAKTIEDEANQQGYEVIFCSTEDDEKRASKLLKMLRYRQVDGYILTPVISLEKEVKALLNEEQPLVLIDRHFPSLDTHYVVLDNFKGAYMATAHLLEQKYEKIAIITTSSRQLQMQQRYDGFLQALKDHHLKHKKQNELILPFNESEEKITGQIRSFLQKVKPDAVFFATNYLAIYGLQVLKQLKWNIPNQIGVISFDDNIAFKLHDPSITCIAQPISLMGKHAVATLMKIIKKGECEKPIQEVLTPKLIVRESCNKTK